jgi:prevent-host-death family protein
LTGKAENATLNACKGWIGRSGVIITTLSRHEFNEDTDGAAKATAEGPVFITDHGEPAHVLLSIEDYQRIVSGKRSLAEALSMPGLSDIELDIPPRRSSIRDVDFD